MTLTITRTITLTLTLTLTLTKSVGTYNFGFEDFQTASIDDCTARWRAVVAAFDYPAAVREDMATRAAQASCIAAGDVQRNAQVS